MSFTRLVEREVQITQSMLIANIFPEENSEEITEHLVPIMHEEERIANNSQEPQLIYLPYNTSVYGSTNTATNRVWRVQTSSTSTNWMSSQITQTTSSLTSTNNIITHTIVNPHFIWYPGYTSTAVSTTECTNLYKEKQKPIKKYVKNSIKRALKLLDNFGMEQDAKIFLKGDEVEVSHPDSLFKFVITKRPYKNIIIATERPSVTVPFSLQLFTKTNIHIANLCVYAENTPMLDNLMMIALYVKSGNEEDLLRKANFFSVTKDLPLKELIVSEVDYLKPKLIRNY